MYLIRSFCVECLYMYNPTCKYIHYYHMQVPVKIMGKVIHFFSVINHPSHVQSFLSLKYKSPQPQRLTRIRLNTSEKTISYTRASRKKYHTASFFKYWRRGRGGEAPKIGRLGGDISTPSLLYSCSIFETYMYVMGRNSLYRP